MTSDTLNGPDAGGPGSGGLGVRGLGADVYGSVLAGALLDSADLACAVLDIGLRHVMISRGLAELGVFGAQDPLGRRPSELYPEPMGHLMEQAALRTLSTGGTVVQAEAGWVRTDAPGFRRCTWSVLRDPAGRACGALGVFADTSHEHRARRLLREERWRTARLQAMTGQLAGALTIEDVARTVATLGRSIGAGRTELHLLDSRVTRFPWPDAPGPAPGAEPRGLPGDWPAAPAAALRDGRARYFPDDCPSASRDERRGVLGPPRSSPEGPGAGLPEPDSGTTGGPPPGRQAASAMPAAVADGPEGPGRPHGPNAREEGGNGEKELDDSSWALLPLASSGSPLGCLRLVFDGRRGFDPDDRAFLDALAGQCAVAVERARLYEREHDAAVSLQRSLLPRSLPAVRGVEFGYRYLPGAPGTEVGGDWYDCFQLPDGRVAVVVGDVIGKGLTAAAGMGRVRSALRALAFTDPEPAEVLSGLDRLFTATEDEESLTTVLYGVLDPAAGELVLGDAGHLPALVVSADGSVRLVDAGPAATPLGIPEARSQRAVRLDPGDIVLGFTDGLVETRSRGLQQGLDRLLEVARGWRAGSDALDSLLGTVVSHMLEGQQRGDDVTVLGVRIAGNGH